MSRVKDRTARAHACDARTHFFKMSLWSLDILSDCGEDHLRVSARAAMSDGKVGPFVPLLA
jgi:hypothetical protein